MGKGASSPVQTACTLMILMTLACLSLHPVRSEQSWLFETGTCYWRAPGRVIKTTKSLSTTIERGITACMIIAAPKILTMGGSAPVLEQGAVVISRGTIVDIGSAIPIAKKYPSHRVLRLDNAALMPGLVNVHTHLELPPLFDRLRARTFPEWVLNLIKAKQLLEGRDYEEAVTRNIETLLRTGTTTVAEICTHGVSPAVLEQSGLRARIYREVLSMHPSFLFPRLSTLVPRPSSRITYGLAPHAPHTVSEQYLRKIKMADRSKRLALSMHVAESADEIRLLQRKRSGFERLYQAARWDLAWAPAADSPFAYLNNIGLLGPRFLAAHAVHATDEDIGILKKTGTAVAHCPRSNEQTGVGSMPLMKFLNAGIVVGLGTDSLASSPSLSLWDEMRFAHRAHKKSGATARDIFRLGTISGARALGLADSIGTLERSKRADMIALRLPEKRTRDIYADLLRETESCSMTMVNGEILFSDEKHVDVDLLRMHRTASVRNQW